MPDCSQCSKKDEADSFKRCSRCKTAAYCSVDCQKEHWKTHKRSCIPDGIVRGMILACESDRANYLFNEIDIDTKHPIHERGIVCPVSVKVGIPLIIYRHIQEDPFSMTRDPGLDNQRATYLMIDPGSGFAPPKWQQCVGSVTVMRRDGKPLTRASIETIWMYHDRLLDLFGDDPADAHAMMNPRDFVKFCEKYKENHPICRDMPVPL